ncbi:hypothetical protein FOZ60_003763 [Perkinsus olseni]|uniref:Uncharacterized protein n=1 Tax=Perkinsus olseni TaxID=32597 RepID=A0A7J6NUQ9_PEROL|nr:hypothetical protein FOZ60_003763 [Perkinsus olseni]
MSPSRYTITSAFLLLLSIWAIFTLVVEEDCAFLPPILRPLPSVPSPAAHPDLVSLSPHYKNLPRSRLIQVGTAQQMAAMPPKPKPGKKKKKKGFWDNDDDINVISENTSYDLIKLDYPSEYLSEHEGRTNKRILVAGDSLLRGVYSAAVEFLKGDRNYCDDRSIPEAERSRCSGDGKYWHDVRSEEAKGKDLRRCERVMKNEGSPCYAGKVEGLCEGNTSLFFTWQPNKEVRRQLREVEALIGSSRAWAFHELARVLRMKGGCADAACRFRKMPEGFGNLYRQFVTYGKFHGELIPGFSDPGWGLGRHVLWLNSLARNETSRQSESKYLDIYELTLREPFRSPLSTTSVPSSPPRCDSTAVPVSEVAESL